MRYALILLSCALVLSGETFCLGEPTPPQAQVQPKKPGFFQRLFHRSGSSDSSSPPRTEKAAADLDQDIDRRFYNPYPKNPVAFGESVTKKSTWMFDPPTAPPSAYPPGKPSALDFKISPPYQIGDFFRTLGSWVTFGYWSRPDKQDDVASVHVAFLGIRAWDDLKGKLETNFSLDANTALTKVVPVVGASSQNFVNVSNTALSASGPAVANAPAMTTAPTTPTTLITADPGSVLTPITGITARQTTLGLDPLQQYRTAQALMQNVAMLNSTIANAPHHEDYDAYVVSLQVTLLPHRRNGAYDVYTDITFVDAADSYANQPAQAGHSGKQMMPQPGETAPDKLISSTTPKPPAVPRVIPLLVTDDLEAVSGTRANRRIMQLSAALSAATPQIAGNGTYQNYTDAINKFMGEETNALVTVARLQENIFRVRFGADVQADSKHLGMVPQAHTVHLLLLYPKQAAKTPAATTGTGYYSCDAIAITHMREADTGRLLRRPSYCDVGRSFYDAVKPFVDAHIFTPDLYRRDNLLELSNYVRLNEYQSFQARAETLLHPAINWTMAQQFLPPSQMINSRPGADYRLKNDALVMSLWSSLSQIFGQSVYSTDNIFFEPVKKADPPSPPQFNSAKPTAVEVLLLDDGTQMTGALTDVSGATPANVSSISVWLGVAGGKDNLFARKITPDASSNLILEFDSLSKYGITPPNDMKMTIQIPEKAADSSPQKAAAAKSAAPPAAPNLHTINVKYQLIDPAHKPASTKTKPVQVALLAHLSSSTQTVTTTGGGTGAFSFSVKVDDAGKVDPSKPTVPPAYKNYIVTVKGAGLSTQPPAGILAGDLIDPSVPIDIKVAGDGQFRVFGDTLVTLQLANIEPGNKITISLDPGDPYDKLNQPMGTTDTLEIKVDTAAATSKR